jgi:hypothetical protein
MGATSFFTFAKGKTVSEAFASAQQDARYDHGHSGYTGTIAEKPSFIEFSVPLADLPVRVMEQLYDTRTGATKMMVTVPLDTRIGNAIYWYQSKRYRYEKGTYDPIAVSDVFATPIESVSVPSWVKEDNREDYIATERKRNEGDRADAKFFADKMGRKDWERMCDVFDEKWEACVAIKVDEGEWLFCGLASC